MNKFDDFFEVHHLLGFIRRDSIGEYWEENQQNDIIARLAPRQINYLATIERFGPCSLQTIMRHTGLSSSAASAAVDKLYRLGIVERIRNAENRREVVVSLKPEIRDHMKKIDARFRNKIATVLKNCTEDEMSLIVDCSTMLCHKLKKIDE
jgi:DNA-binding MarR family transcriptional regulator